MTNKHLIQSIVDEIRDVVEYEEHRSHREDFTQLPDDIRLKVSDLTVLVFLDGRLRYPRVASRDPPATCSCPAVDILSVRTLSYILILQETVYPIGYILIKVSKNDT